MSAAAIKKTYPKLGLMESICYILWSKTVLSITLSVISWSRNEKWNIKLIDFRALTNRKHKQVKSSLFFKKNVLYGIPAQSLKVM